MSESIKEKIARIKAQRAAALSSFGTPKEEPQADVETPVAEELISNSLQKVHELMGAHVPHFTANITLNAEQQRAVDWAKEGRSFCLAGAAGTGKTTTTKAIIAALLESENVPLFSFSTKHLATSSPALVVTAFTKRATKNAAEAINNPAITCVNFHKLVEYAPVFYEVQDPKTGEFKKTMRFEPTYNSLNKLPKIQTILIDESSQFSVPMFETLTAALSENGIKVQFIFIGDIQQIPPTMGTSIYGPKLLELPAVELTQVYRQALESPIIRFLTDMRSGKGITRNDWKNYTRKEDGTPNNKMRMGVFPAKLHWEDALHQAASYLRQEFESGNYDPYNDMVLVPFNVKFGTVALNKLIAEMLDHKEKRTVVPIVCGWQHHYYSIGDHVLFNTEDYVIEAIEIEPKYSGTDPAPPSKFIDREGLVLNRKEYEKEQLAHSPDLDLTDNIEHISEAEQKHIHNPLSVEEFLMVQMAKGIEEKTNTGSHIITLRSLDDPDMAPIKISAVGDLMKLALSYAITVHKAQGLQAPKVYFFLHRSHSPMHYRELIYTACSRPKEQLTIICDPDVLARGIQTQRIEGTTLEEKKEYFRALLGTKAKEEIEESEASSEQEENI